MPPPHGKSRTAPPAMPVRAPPRMGRCEMYWGGATRWGDWGERPKRGAAGAALGRWGGEKQREWYQRMLLALQVKQAKRIEDMEARFEEELRRRTDMHETALQQMAAQAAGEEDGRTVNEGHNLVVLLFLDKSEESRRNVAMFISSWALPLIRLGTIQLVL